MQGFKDKTDLLIGVISDTHGLLRPEVSPAFSGVDLIFHAGDVDRPAVLDELSKIAPVLAVRGNMDGGAWADGLNTQEAVELGGAHFYMRHNLHELDLDPSVFQMVIFGHTHQPALRTENQVIFFNPGSAGPRRFDYPVSVGRIRLRNGQPEPEIIELIG